MDYYVEPNRITIGGITYTSDLIKPNAGINIEEFKDYQRALAKEHQKFLDQTKDLKQTTLF